MGFEGTKLLVKRVFVSRRHAGSGGNNTLVRLARQGMPYYLRRDGWAKPPMTVFFTINGTCNMRCRMCDIGEKNADSMFYHNLHGEAGGDFPIERFKSLMDEFAEFRPFIGITTTEPFLYKHLFDGVAYARAKGLTTNVTTNGLRVEKFVDEILESGLQRLSVSIDGPPRIHNEMRRMPGAFERVMRGLRMLSEKKKVLGRQYPEILVNSFVADTNHAYVLEMVESLPLDSIDGVNIKLMVFQTQDMVERHNAEFGDKYPATKACFPDDFAARNLNIDRLYEQTMEINRKYGDKVTLHFEPDKANFEQYFHRPGEFMDASKCVLPWFIAQLTNDGDLAVYTRCYDVRLGNVLDRPFAEVWNGPKMREFRRDLQNHGRFPGCARCDGVLYR